MEQHGAAKIRQLKFRESYVFMGRRGASKGDTFVEVVSSTAVGVGQRVS